VKEHSTTDQDLIRQLRGSRMMGYARREHERAFAELYARHAQRVYAYILRMLGEQAASQDLLQETFFKFYNAAREDLVVTNTRAFLIMIARNLCLNWMRDTRQNVSIDAMEFSFDDETVERNDLSRILNLALELLDFEHREAFVLKYYQGYSYEEMSRMTGETVAALRNRVWRAKEEIRRTLKPYAEELGITDDRSSQTG
jgi:RNA polymerase sigma-70 factor, ECF subfamily